MWPLCWVLIINNAEDVQVGTWLTREGRVSLTGQDGMVWQTAG